MYCSGISYQLVIKNFTMNYLLDRPIHYVTDDGDLFVLAQPENPPDCLHFDRGIPLRFQDVDPSCNRKV
jgi:hypothetical protein